MKILVFTLLAVLMGTNAYGGRAVVGEYVTDNLNCTRQDYREAEARAQEVADKYCQGQGFIASYSIRQFCEEHSRGGKAIFSGEFWCSPIK